MSAAAPLLTLLRRIRRRLRWWMALEGAVIGAAGGAVAAAAAILGAHLAGHIVGARAPIAFVAASIIVGAIARGARRVPLTSCARFADAALDGHDRVLSAYFLREQETPLARALVVDAAARARTLTPGGAVAPRRPKGLPALALGALVLAAAAIAPVRSRAARAIVAPAPAPGVPLAASALDVERAEAGRAAAAAAALGDERLAQLAVDLDATLRRLAAGKLSDGDALEQLGALQRRAAEDAAAAAREAKALAAAEKALSDESATRGAGEALGAEDGDAGERARAALGAAAAQDPSATSRALSAAARGVASALAAADGAKDGDGQRRLAREGDKNGGEAAADDRSPGERRLERLERNLGDTAAACRAGDPSCRAQAEKRGQDLGDLARRGASAEALRRLERALRQMRERIGRGETRGSDGEAMRGFERAARGASGQPQPGAGQGQGQQGRQGAQGEQGGQQGDGVAGGEGSGQAQADATGAGQGSGKDGKPGHGGGKDGKPGQGNGTDGKPGAGKGAGEGHGHGPGDGDGDGDDATALAEAAAMLAERESREAGGSAAGEGQGTGAGGPPLGRRGDMLARGQETEARVANGAGPKRAEVIGGAADRGFAQRDYARVFGDYQAAVEDALAATAVPEGRRYVVRRYFDLIRPRPGKARK